MVYFIYLAILSSATMIIYSFSMMLILPGAVFFLLLCALLFLLDEYLEENRRYNAERLLKSTTAYLIKKPRPLSADVFSNIDWSVGRNYSLTQFSELPGMEQFPSMRSRPRLNDIFSEDESMLFNHARRNNFQIPNSNSL